MLKTVLSISGRPGLYKLVSQGKNMLIVEAIGNGKRLPAYAHDKIISLGDIAIYTLEEDNTYSIEKLPIPYEDPMFHQSFSSYQQYFF